MSTKGPYFGLVLLFAGTFVITCEVLDRLYNAQLQVDAKYCMHHDFTYSGVSLVRCTAMCVRSGGCRAVVFKAPTRTCLGCGYAMDIYYADKYEVPVDILSGSVLYTPALSGYQYIGYYADCGPPFNDPWAPCGGNRTLPLMFASNAMTPALCFELCERFGTRYFGNEAWKYCLCGLVYDKFGTTNNMNTTCNGDVSQICGGLRALSVYESMIKN